MSGPRNRSWVCRRAFTLVEVLAALTLAAIILPVAMQGVSLALAAADHAKRQVEAASLAEAKLAELVLTSSWQEADLSGDFGDEHPGYTWTAEVENWDESALQCLDVHVFWEARNTKRSVTLTTLVRAESE